MSPIRALAPDQRAVLELLLRQGRSYAELSELLGIPEAAVRSRAHTALATLAPDRPAPVGEDGAVADWILGQQDETEAGATSAAIARTPAWRAWAADVTDRLAEVDGAELPDVPEGEEEAASRPAAKTKGAKPKAKARAGGPVPARRPRPVRDGATAAGAAARPRPVKDGARPARAPDDRPAPASLPLRSSKLGGALLIGVLALLIGVVLIVFVFRDDDPEEAASGPSPTATASATPQVVSEIPMQGVGSKAQGLMRVFRRDQDGKLVFALAADKMPRNRTQEVYAVWFTKQGGTPRNLGFAQTQVAKDGVFTTGGPQEGQETDFAKWLSEYETVVVARAAANTASAKRPGQVVLRGTLPGGQ